jgi:hypothetical protein
MVSDCDYCDNPITGTPVVDPDDLMDREYCSDGCLTTADEAFHGAFAARERD